MIRLSLNDIWDEWRNDITYGNLYRSMTIVEK